MHSLLLLIALCSLSYALTSPTFVVKESIKSAPWAFTRQSSATSISRNITLRIQLAQRNISGLEAELYAVSTPEKERYGQHLSAAEVALYVSPTEETHSLVTAWLKKNGLTPKSVSTFGDWLAITLPVSQANELLDTEFSVYEDMKGNEFVRTLSYSVPSTLEQHVDLILPTVNFPISASTGKHAPTKRVIVRDIPPASCAEELTPICLQDLYSIPNAPANSTSNSLWVSGFLGDFVDHSDVSSFIVQFRPDIPSSVNTTFAVVEVNGGTNSEDPQDAGFEAVLDVEYTVGLATGVPVTFLSVGPNNSSASDQDFLQALLVEADYLVGLENPPYVLTTSYGVDETEVDPALANSICNAYMQLGARGTSVLFASGDGGVDGVHGAGGCTGEPFVPVFPATCPYITAVGGTFLLPPDNVEEAASLSSGGFSNLFREPWYQSTAVSSYFSYLGSTYSGLYNASGRGFPDVSANAFAEILLSGSDLFVTGTSCASPTFASVIALVNDRLVFAGKPPLGFLNPFLYANPGALNDITAGDNPGCGTNGFNATIGWDPITGLGTPNFTALACAAGV